MIIKLKPFNQGNPALEWALLDSGFAPAWGGLWSSTARELATQYKIILPMFKEQSWYMLSPNGKEFKRGSFEISRIENSTSDATKIVCKDGVKIYIPRFIEDIPFDKFTLGITGNKLFIREVNTNPTREFLYEFIDPEE